MSDRNYHPAKRLAAPDGSRADIDVMLVPLMEALWADGYETIGSCQNLGESAGTLSRRSRTHWQGYVLLEMPVPDACRLLDAVKDTPQFAEYMHWADKGAWETSVSVLPLGLRSAVMPWAQVHFPNRQIGDLVNVIRGDS